MSEPIVPKLMQEQIAILDNLLRPLVDGDPRSPYVEYILTKDDLDRETANKRDRGTVALAFKNYKDETVAAVCQAIQESHRVRRDVKIARANHKRLMAASIRTAYNKRTQLKYLLPDLGNKKDKQ